MQISANTSALTSGQLQLKCTTCWTVVYKESWDDTKSLHHKRHVLTKSIFGFKFFKRVPHGIDPMKGYACPVCKE